MSIAYDLKLKAIRRNEGLTQSQFADMTGISLGVLKNYESKQKKVGLSVIERVIECPTLTKYALWLMTDQTAPESGQIAPPNEFLEDVVLNKKTI